MAPHPVSHADRGERLFALDNLRAVMMWLGIVLHVAVIHTVRPSPLPWHDRQTSEWADLLVAWIHSFRMPTFFILAGYFVAMLMQQRGWRGMLKNRLLRLGVPFALLWPPLYLACGVLALLFLHRMARGSWGWDESLLPMKADAPRVNTLHLWFIWMLLWFSLATAALAPLARAIPQGLVACGSWVFGRGVCGAWGPLVLALPLAWAGAFYQEGFLTTQGAFVPPLAEWLHNGLFYGFGLALYTQRAVLLPQLAQGWRWRAGVGLVFFVGSMGLVTLQSAHGLALANFAWWSALVYNLCTWFWSLALMGLFLRHVHGNRPTLRYLSQASYWVYLIHLPATIGFGALLYEAPLSAGAKMALNILATSAVSLLSYHVLVRSTPLGWLLTGQSHPWVLPDCWGRLLQKA